MPDHRQTSTSLRRGGTGAAPRARAAVQQFGDRRSDARTLRHCTADLAFQRAPANFPLASATTPYASPLFAPHRTNGDEHRYSPGNSETRFPYFGSFTKGLPHGPNGIVDVAAYETLVHALDTLRMHPDNSVNGLPGIDAVPRGTVHGGRPFVNPLAGMSFDLNGADAWDFTCPPAPDAASAEAAGEMVELYWMALMRDVPFTAYPSHPQAQRACADLTALADFRGPRSAAAASSDAVTPRELFRGSAAGNEIGHYLSQFMLKPVPFGTQVIEQRQRTAVAGVDYMTSPGSWLAVQQGANVTGTDLFDPERRYIRNMRDLATYVHFDALYQAYFNACLILIGMGAPLDAGNPYRGRRNQEGFGVHGGPHLLSLVTEVASRALKAVWFQKWFVHRRMRPEQFCGRVAMLMTSGTPASEMPHYVHQDLLDSAACGQILAAHGGHFLPQAFPEGSPMHPAYGAGHATVAGACVTILKAWFDESWILPDPVVPNAEGTALVSDPAQEPLTVGGELNKLAANVSIGRNGAGVHWRTDYTKSVALGEAVAVSILQEQSRTDNEGGAYTLTTFSGTSIRIARGAVTTM